MPQELPAVDPAMEEASSGATTQPASLTEVFFQKVELDKDQRQAIAEDLHKHIREGMAARGDLDDLLMRWNDMAEGIAAPKNFPWEESSNLFVPITEIHLSNIHAASRQTLLKGDQIVHVRSVGYKNPDPSRASRLERYLNFKSMVELPLTDRFSQGISCSLRDGTSLLQIQWAEEKDKVRRIRTFNTEAEFRAQYPTPGGDIPESKYNKVLKELSENKIAKLIVSEDKISYKGPVVTVVQLADFIMSPMTAVMTKFANLVGKVFTLSSSELKRLEKFNHWDDVQDVIDSKEDGRKDQATESKNDIEGISRRAGHGEFVMVDGIHRYDLDGDGIDEMYLFAFHPATKTVCDYMYYPYFHGRDCFVPLRWKKRPGRFLARGICQMLEDINSEINTQHNQRIDSRTITTVPTFKAKSNTKNTFNPERKDQRFQPGRVFYLESMDDVQQFDIRPVDMGETLQEESALMELADKETGATQLRSGMETKADPRAPAAKVNMLLNQSNVRLDDGFEELAGSAIDNEGLSGALYQILELYYQFFDEDLAEIPLLKPDMQPEMDAQNKPATMKFRQEDLVTDGLRIQMAKTSSMLNPDSMLLKFMQVFQLLISDPLVGGRPKSRLELIRELLALARVENQDKYLPKDEQEAAMAMGVAQILAMSQGGKGGKKSGGQGPGTRHDGTNRPTAPAAGGSTRPNG